MISAQLSKSISNLRFPLACLIVLKHYYTPDISAEMLGGAIYGNIGEFFTFIFTDIPVPLFFFISGYLYFVDFDISSNFSFCKYLNKQKKRIRSLLVPYLSWNLIVLLLYSFVQLSINKNNDTFSNDGYKFILDYTWLDFIKAFVALDSTGFPIDGPIWFIRDLFFVTFFTPFIFYGIKYLNWFFVMIVLYIGSFPGFPAFFVYGATFALLAPKFLNCVSTTDKVIHICLFVISLSIVSYLYFSDKTCELYDSAKEIFLLTGVLAYISWGDKLYSSNMLSNCSFFVFASHKPIMVIIRRLFFNLFHPENEIILILLQFLIPIIVIAICVLLFLFIKKKLPVLAFLNGYRL